MAPPQTAGCVWRPHAPARPTEALATIRVDPTTDDAFACPLTWLAGDWRVESWQTSAAVYDAPALGWAVRRTLELAFVARDIPAAQVRDSRALEHQLAEAYRSLAALAQHLALPYLQRVWHWLHGILDGTGEGQRYRAMCRGRARGIEARHAGVTLPPATGVGSHRPGVRLQALLGTQPIRPIENPRQLSAYRYPPEHGRQPPSFARAGLCRLADTPYLLVSGTASIVGHRTRHAGDTRRQTEEALANVAAVLDAAAPDIGAHNLSELAGIRAYVRAPAEADKVLDMLREAAPGVPVALLETRLCRDDLGVELETQLPV